MQLLQFVSFFGPDSNHSSMIISMVFLVNILGRHTHHCHKKQNRLEATYTALSRRLYGHQ